MKQKPNKNPKSKQLFHCIIIISTTITIIIIMIWAIIITLFVFLYYAYDCLTHSYNSVTRPGERWQHLCSAGFQTDLGLTTNL